MYKLLVSGHVNHGKANPIPSLRFHVKQGFLLGCRLNGICKFRRKYPSKLACRRLDLFQAAGI